eukprot:3549339-Pleurochrysis_carterae.AAC.4
MSSALLGFHKAAGSRDSEWLYLQECTLLVYVLRTYPPLSARFVVLPMAYGNRIPRSLESLVEVA